MVVRNFAQREPSGRKHVIIALPRPLLSSLAHVPSHASDAERHNNARGKLPGRGKVHHTCASALRRPLRMDVAARLRGHIGNNEDASIDYGQRHRACQADPECTDRGRRHPPGHARMSKRRRMRWSPRGRSPPAPGQGRGAGQTLRPAGNPVRGGVPQVCRPRCSNRSPTLHELRQCAHRRPGKGWERWGR
jgi:hypothetical protein